MELLLTPRTDVPPPEEQPGINLSPLYAACQQFGGPTYTPADLGQSVSEVIKFINLNCAVANSDVFYDLYRLQEMFEAMSQPPEPAR